MAAIDLTTLAAVKPWLTVTDTNSDTLLGALITAASRVILNYTGRSTFELTPYTDIYDGNGKNWLLLRQWPVMSVATISYDSAVITSAASGVPLANGYLLEPPLAGGGNQRLTLFGYAMPRGRSNVQITYSAGYATTPEDVGQACCELVGEMFRRKDHIGQMSKTLGGQETISFAQSAMNATIKLSLDTYIRKIPC